MVPTRLCLKREPRCGIFGPGSGAVLVSWRKKMAPRWTSCPLSSSKVIIPLAKKVPVNDFSASPLLLPSESASPNSSTADVTNSWWLSCSCVTARCGRWFVWVVIDLGVFVLFKQSNYWFCLLLCLGACSLRRTPRPSLLVLPVPEESFCFGLNFPPLVSYLFDSFLSQNINPMTVLRSWMRCTPERYTVAQALPSTNKVVCFFPPRALCSCCLWNHRATVIFGWILGTGHEYDTERV